MKYKTHPWWGKTAETRGGSAGSNYAVRDGTDKRVFGAAGISEINTRRKSALRRYLKKVIDREKIRNEGA